MKKIFVLAVAAFVLFSGGIGSSSETSVSPSGEVKTEVKTGEGTTIITATEGGAGPEWCKAGTTVTTAGPTGEAKYVIKGITTYKGRQVCESEAKFSGEGSAGSWTYYYNEDGSFGAIIIKDASGNVISETETTG